MDKDRKTDNEIQKEIIKCLLNKDWEWTTISTIQKEINSNWITAEKFIRILAQSGILKLALAEDKEQNILIKRDILLTKLKLIENRKVFKLGEVK